MAQPLWLRIEGARQNNLKNVSLAIPHDRVTVITGVSGSGKSSLAFDTLFAEGQWRYIESLSTYARMFLERLDRPDVDRIEHIRPAIALEQKNPVRTARSTVGTATELHDYLRLLFAMVDLADAQGEAVPSLDGQPVQVVLDRVIVGPEARRRLTESLETALAEGDGRAVVDVVGHGPRSVSREFRCPRCEVALARPQPLLFSFNHPLGACPECKGFGNILKYDEARVVPDPTRTLADGAVEPWTYPSGKWYQRQLVKSAKRLGLDLETPCQKLSEDQRRLVYDGHGSFPGIQGFFEEVESYRYKLHVRVFLSRYRSQSRCPTCTGTRLRPAALAVKVAALTISDFTGLTIEQAARVTADLPLTAWELSVAREILKQLNAKLAFLLRVGLGYLTLGRQTRTLSGGEAQRINLANQLGSQLVGTLYVLDEPSIGLHARDTTRLADLCHELAQAGNTVVVVEHDRGFIESADHVVELGPGSGERGGEIVFNGPQNEFVKATRSLTARYLTGRETIPVPVIRRTARRHLVLAGARQHNLKDVTLRLPLGTLTVVSGVSGSGKSTLVHDTLYQAVARAFKTDFASPGEHESLVGLEYLKGMRLIDQEPIGRTPRSNPVTYVKAFDEIRKIFAELPRAKTLGLSAGSFSFNVSGGAARNVRATASRS